MNLQYDFAVEKVSLGIPGCTNQGNASSSREVIAPLPLALARLLLGSPVQKGYWPTGADATKGQQDAQGLGNMMCPEVPRAGSKLRGDLSVLQLRSGRVQGRQAHLVGAESSWRCAVIGQEGRDTQVATWEVPVKFGDVLTMRQVKQTPWEAAGEVVEPPSLKMLATQLGTAVSKLIYVGLWAGRWTRCSPCDHFN